MSDCLTPEELEAIARTDSLPEDARARAHLESCDDCRQQVQRMRDALKLIERAREAAPESDGFLSDENAASDVEPTLDTDDLREPLRLTIEGYEILRELHRGGQGVVYEAIQTATKRKVAVKVLLEGPHASKSAQKRFEREIELVAGLKHSNIVSVFHSGKTADGRDFCAMDYVRGLPLHHHVREKKLTLEQTLELFAKVCEAVNYAHQRGVIHRDLKPSNILVDAEGAPKVLDFGLAKIVGGPEQTAISMTGQVVGTLPYVSPEQGRGDPDEIDIRTDVYALGVILYETLTGHYPYPIAGLMADVLRHIAETPPTPPSKAWEASSGVAGRSAGRRISRTGCPIDNEVETIVLKCLSKEPERRYQSAGELGRDLHHYLAGEPIEAKRDSGLYVLKKSLQRYKLPAAVAAGFVVVVTAALTASLAFWREAATQRDVAFTERERAGANLKRARQAVDRYYTLISEDLMLDRPDLGTTRKRLLQEALEHYNSFVDQNADNPQLRAELVAAYFRISLITFEFGEMHWLDPFEKGVELARQVAEQNSGVMQFKSWAAGIMRPRYRFGVNRADPLDAFRAFQEASDIWKKLVRKNPRVWGLQSDLATFYTMLGEAHHALGDLEEKIYFFEQACDVWAHLVRECPGSCEYQFHWAQAHHELAWALQGAQKFGESERSSRKALELLARLTSERPSVPVYHYYVAEGHSNLGILFTKMEQHQQAEEAFRRSIDCFLELSADVPGFPDYRLEAAMNCEHLVELLLDLGRTQDAECVMQQELTIRRKLAATHPRSSLLLRVYLDPGPSVYRRQFAASCANYAVRLRQLGKLDEGIALLREEMAARRQLVTESPNIRDYRLGFIRSYRGLATQFSKVGRYEEAERLYRDALQFWQKLAVGFPGEPAHRQNLATTHKRLGDHLWDIGRHREAKDAYGEGIKAREKLALEFPNEPAHWRRLANYREHFGARLWEIGDNREGGAELRRAVTAWNHALQADPKNAIANNGLAWFFATCPEPQLRDPARAVELAEKATRIWPKAGFCWNTLGAAHYRAGDWQAAVSALTRSVELDSGGSAYDFFFLAMAHWRLGQKEQGREWYAKALEWVSKKKPDSGDLHRFRAEAAKLLGVTTQPATTASEAAP